MTNRFFAVVLIAFLLFMLTGCATDLSRAQTHFKDGNYEDAVDFYQRALASDPSNSEAAMGIRRSRDLWINRKLIEVRLHRLAGSAEQSLDLLSLVIDKEKLWQTFPTGAAVFTQEEETSFAAHSAHALISEALRQKKPLLAMSILNQREGFFQANRRRKLDELRGRVRDQGRSDCTNLVSRIQSADFYYGLFTQKYCQLFGGKLPDLSAQAKSEALNLYGDIEVIDDMLEPGTEKRIATQQVMKEVFAQDFKSTPWYDPRGKKRLTIRTHSQFKSDHTVSNRTLTHTYQVAVRDTDSRSTPLDDFHPTLNASPVLIGIAIAVLAVVIVADAMGDRNDDESITTANGNYHYEPRTITYEAKEHVQNFKFSLKGDVLLDNSVLPLEIEQSDTHKSIEHANKDSVAGLAPKAPELIADNDWLKSQIQKASAQLKLKSVDAWNDTYCTNKTGTTVLTPDRFFRCWHTNSARLPKEMENWFINTFGLSPTEADQLLGT